MSLSLLFRSGNRGSKGSAIDIALAYKKKKLEEEGMLRDEDKIKAKKVAKMINSQDSKSSNSSSSKRMSPLLSSSVSSPDLVLSLPFQ